MRKHPLLLTFIFTALCLLPVMLLRDFTPDNELRYLQIADEAIENGNVFAFTLQGEAYADKPPLYLWLVILSRLLLGKHSMLILSLFSLIPAFITIHVMDKWVKPGGAVDRISVAFMMMTCALFLGASVFLRMDMLMTMFIVLALYSFWQLYEDHSSGSGTVNRKRHEILLPVWIFLALFTKGPVGILMPPLAIICFLLLKKKGSEIGRYLGWKTWGIIAALCVVWFTGVYLDGGKDYLNNLLFHQTMGRAVNSFHHKAPFWYYFTAIWYIVAPYMFLLVGAIVISLIDSIRSCHPERSEGSCRSEGPNDKEVFFLVTIVSTFVMLSIFSGKLAIYLAPIMPFMVMLFVEVLRRTGWQKWMTWMLAVPLILIAAIGVAALGVLLFTGPEGRLADLISPYPFLRSGMVKFALFMLSLGFILATYSLFKGRPAICLIFTGASMLLSVYAASSVLPQANDWIGWGNLCKTISPEEEVATLYLRRPYPMKVYLGREVSDYQRDFEEFYKAEAEDRKPSDGPLVLVTQSKRLTRDEALGDFVKGKSLWYVGPYCLVQVDPEDEEKNTLSNEL